MVSGNVCCLSVHFQTLATLARPWECSTRTVHTADRGGHSIGFYHSHAGVGVYVHLYQGKIRREYTKDCACILKKIIRIILR